MGHAKAPKAKAATAQTVYKNTNNATFGSDFGTGTSSIDPKTGQLTTNATLAPGLQQANNTAMSGLNSNLSYLSQDPNAVFGNMTAGNDPYYNNLAIQTQRANDQAIAQARLRGAATGNNNSTTLGSELGRLNSDNALQQAQNMVSAYTFGSDNARQNAATNQNAITGMANLAYPLGSAANSNLMTALGARDNNSQFNANNQQAVNLANQQAQIQTNAQNSSSTGNLINAGVTAAAIAAAPFTGGASLMAIPASKAATGGGSSGGSSTSGQYGFSNPAINQSFQNAYPTTPSFTMGTY